MSWWGAPAHIIKYRFCEDLITALLIIDYSKLSKEIIESNIDRLLVEIKGIRDIQWLIDIWHK